MRVAVIVVNWNGRAHLARCLPALAEQSYTNFEIVVVDNASTDGSVEWLYQAWPDVQLIEAGANLGFAAANNLAIAVTEAPWVALVNNDTVPEPGWLEAMVAAGGSDERVGSVASLMLFLDQPDVINSAGINVDPVGIAWDRLGGAPATAGESATEVFGASAGAALFRRAALDDVAEVGRDGRCEVFDERFFMYMEDVDLAWRLRLRGWRSVYAPTAQVLHRGSASAGEGSPFKNRLLARNKLWTVLKNYPTAPLARNSMAVLFYDLASAPYRLLVQGQAAALLGRLDALGGLGETLRRRRVVQARRTAPWAEIGQALSPLEPPWKVLSRYRHLSGRGRSPRAAGPA